MTTAFGTGKDVARAIAIDSAGRLVVAGEDGSSSSELFALARYLPGGQLDKSFGGDGRVTTPVGNPAGEYAAIGVAIQPNGRIVAVGQGTASDPFGDFAVARYLPDGRLDRSFAGDGLVTTDFGTRDHARDVALLANGKIVAGGYSGSEFAAARYNTNGTPDNSFSGDGKLTLSFFDFRPDFGLAAARDGSGRVLIAGQVAEQVQDYDFGVARLLDNGAPDPSFGGGDGKVSFTFFAGGDPNNETVNEYAHDVVIAPGGDVLLAGEAGDSFGLARLNPSGLFFLPSFGGGDGRVLTNFGPGVASGREVAIGADGKIVVAGDHDKSRFAIARYDSNGGLDATFSGDGRQLTDFGAYDVGRAMALQADGRAVVAGGASPDVSLDFGLARYLTGGDPRCRGRIASIVATGRRVPGSAGPDVIAGRAGRQVISAKAGKDLVCGKGGKDVLRGGKGRDRLFGGKGRDRLLGGGGRDRLLGGGGRDRCIGGGARDRAASCERAAGI